MDTKSDVVTWQINSSIVETIIGETRGSFQCRYHDDDTDPVNVIRKAAAKKQKEKENAMKMFVKKPADETAVYTVAINNITCFCLALDHVSSCMSFSQTAHAIQHAKDCTKSAKLTGINDHIAGQYVRVMVATSLQEICTMVSDDLV
ncbi:hypothetical protein MPTK1_6g08710 [Marchantia polymorpha subsp. ruderalis]|uniref:Uncharacterized protein n=2 Tax=Marchantia polymorpha TaxID=3197 RepID=A0AAF6BPZ8_MARPO|nr:hypothetical protein MARPO_0060s0050 [Marchantia polymorpha]BBN14082.1 hypothetical protein Mp_6g08710 [Marchantia polymorpha subsp. ruderalis]|eukprot:PTQ36963.1 hypothetical protein MARPO_0060s0050 [Marchantia polymorpha]